MPEFKENRGFKMEGWSAFTKDVTMYQGDGTKITVDDANLGETYRDENGNKARDWTYIKNGKKGTDVLYMKPPRGESPYEGKEVKKPRNLA